MNKVRSDVFTEMKKEDRKFGECGGKSQTAKDHQKREKHAVDFRKMRPSEIALMEEDYSLEEDFDTVH